MNRFLTDPAYRVEVSKRQAEEREAKRQREEPDKKLTFFEDRERERDRER